MRGLVFILLLVSPVVFAQYPKGMKMNEKMPETIFLRKVEDAVRRHDQAQLMSFVEPGYKRTQHDEFLEGRTKQFLEELFWCEELPYKLFELTDARVTSYRRLARTENDYDVWMWITDGSAACTCSFRMTRDPGTSVFSIYGAVG